MPGGKQSQLLLQPTKVELGLQVGVEFDNNSYSNQLKLSWVCKLEWSLTIQKLLTQIIFGPKIILTQIYLTQKILHPNWFLSIFWTNNYFWQKIFLDPKFSLTRDFLDLELLLTQKFIEPNIF